MSTLTLPHVAALYCGDGHAWYPARPAIPTKPDESDVLWFAEPVIPAGCPMRWADDHEVLTPHLVLDRTTIAELLYASALDPVWPISDAQLAAIVLYEVERCHCDLTAAVARLAQDAGDHPEACADRMTACLALAARLAPPMAVETGADRKAIER